VSLQKVKHVQTLASADMHNICPRHISQIHPVLVRLELE